MSAAAPRTTRKGRDLQQARVKRQKQIVAVGSVLLLAVLGFELPNLMSGGSGTPPARNLGDASLTPTLASPLAVGPLTLPDTDRVVIQPQSGQLISFGLFKSKDPFVQQLSTVTTATPAQPAATATTPSQPHQPPRRTAPAGGAVVLPNDPTQPQGSTVPFPSTTPISTPPAATTPAASTPATTTPAVPATAPGTVAISTNGACEIVALKGTFPGSEDIFRVTAIAKDGKSVKIAVVGGKYDSGQATATLKKGEKLTLVNTADGTRYVILFKDSCDTETAPVPGGITTTTTTAPAVVSPPPAATTPVVTDAVDTTPVG